MVRITSDGEIIVGNGINLTSKKRIINGTNLLTDGSHILNLQDHTIPIYALTSTLQSKVLIGTLINYDIVISCTNKVDPGKDLIVDVPIPAGFTLIKATSNEGTYDPATDQWTLVMENQEATLNLLLDPITAGSWQQIVTLDGTITTLTSTCVISSTDSDGSINSYEAMDSSDYPILEANLQDGQEYTAIMYSRVHDTGVTGIHDGIKNNRFSLLNGTKAIYSNRATLQDSIIKTTVTFTYDSDYPVVITRNDQYYTISTVGEELWYGLCIREGLNKEYEESANLLTNPAALLNDTSYSNITLDGASESAKYDYTFQIPSLTGDKNPFYSGLVAKLNSFKPNTNVELSILSSTGNESSKQSAYTTGTGTVNFGELDDLWELLPDDINGATLTVSIIISNSSQEQQIFQYSNLVLYTYYQDDETEGKLGFSFGGRQLRHFGGHLSDDDHPVGVNKTVTTLSETKSDGVLITDDSAGGKTIVTTISLVAYDLPTAWEQVNNIARWLGTPKNEYQFPELQELIFDYNQSRVYMAALAEEIAVTKEHPKLVLKAKFIVPSGVALSVDAKVTGANGTNYGIVKAKPVIVFEADGSSSIVITENTTGNTFTIDTTVPSGTVLTLDNETRKVTDELEVDYEEFIANDSTRLILLPKTAYSFSITGGSIKYVSFKEKF